MFVTNKYVYETFTVCDIDAQPFYMHDAVTFTFDLEPPKAKQN